MLEQLMRRVGSVLFWAGVLVLGGFGVVFSFANYPWFGIGVVLLILLLAGYRERRRRTAQKARDTARRRDRERATS
jgi:flagellar biosynthesis component FlhA